MRISDWSSDVCSSDLDLVFGFPSEASAVPKMGSAAYDLTFSGTRSSSATDSLLDMVGDGTALVDSGTGQLEIAGKTALFTFFGAGILSVESEGDVQASGARSEERRVGKEGGRTGKSRWVRDTSKKNTKRTSYLSN